MILVTTSLFNHAISQSVGTIVRQKINSNIPSNSTKAITAAKLRETLNSVVDYSSTKVPYVSMSELRAGKADTAGMVNLSDVGKAGLLRYDRNDTTSPADSVMVFVTVDGKRYIRQYETDINASWLTASTESSFVKVINYVASKPVTIIINRIIPITSNRTIPSNISLRFENGGGFDISNGVLLTINSQIKEGSQRLFYGLGNAKLTTDQVNVAWFGAVADFNTTTLTGTDNTEAFRKATYTVTLGGCNEVFIPRGNFGLTKYIIENVSIVARKRTTLWALPSAEPAFFKLKEGVVQNVTIGGFHLRGRPGNTNQIGLDITAILSTSENTGGLWYSNIRDMQISGFEGHAANFEALDPLVGGVYKDIANQFLTFDNVRLFRSNTTSRALKANGQFGQVIFNNCEFDGAIGQSVVNSTNVELVSSTTTGDSDEIYSVDFNTCTFQEGDKGIRTFYAKSVSFNGCHWENMARPMYLEAGSEVKVGVAYFGNSGLGSLVTGGTIDGTLVFVGSTCLFDADQLNAVGFHDFTAIGSSPTGFSVKRTNFLPNYKDLDAQVSVAVDGSLTLFNYSGRILLSSNANELSQINSYKGLGETIVLHPLGTLTLNATGNIAFPGGETKLIFRAGQMVVLKRRATKWDVVNSNDSFHVRGSGDPEGVVTAMAGTVYHRLPTQLLYVKTTDGGNTGWLSSGAIPSIRTASGNGSSTTITIAHSLTYTPVVRSYAANNAESAKVKYITADATNFILNFDVAPASGTNNLSYSISYTR